MISQLVKGACHLRRQRKPTAHRTTKHADNDLVIRRLVWIISTCLTIRPNQIVDTPIIGAPLRILKISALARRA